MRACFCPSVMPIDIFCGLPTGVLMGDLTVTVCERAWVSLSEECLFFLTRPGAMMIFNVISNLSPSIR